MNLNNMSDNQIAPVALFVFKRLDHVKKTLESLARNELALDTDLIIFSDGPASKKDVDDVARVRNFLSQVYGFKSVKTVFRESNLGLSKSIKSGLGEMFLHYESIIVLEDDMITSTYFLKFMNEALQKYKNDNRVASISGYVYPTEGKLPENFFIRGADCWGWATWSRGWMLYSDDGEFLLEKIIKGRLERIFDFNRSYPYTEMLMDQIEGRNDSWAIRWYAATFLQGKLTLYPGRSLVHNIGNDESGTHSRKNNAYDTCVALTPIRIDEIDVVESEVARKIFEKYFRHIFNWKILIIWHIFSSSNIRYFKKIVDKKCGESWKKKIKKFIYSDSV
jgi:hypothetical protein